MKFDLEMKSRVDKDERGDPNTNELSLLNFFSFWNFFG